MASTTAGDIAPHEQGYTLDTTGHYDGYNAQLNENVYASKYSNTASYETYLVDTPPHVKVTEPQHFNPSSLTAKQASASYQHPRSYNAYDPPAPSSKSTRLKRMQDVPITTSYTSHNLHSMDPRAQNGHLTEIDKLPGETSWTYQKPYGNHQHQSDFNSYPYAPSGVRTEQLGEPDQAFNRDGLSQEFNMESQSINSHLSNDDPHRGTSYSTVDVGAHMTDYRNGEGYYSAVPYNLSEMASGIEVPSYSSRYPATNIHSSVETNDPQFGQGSVVRSNTYPYVTLQQSSPKSRRLSQDSSSLAASIPLPISPNTVPRSPVSFVNGDIPSQHFEHNSQRVHDSITEKFTELSVDDRAINYLQSQESHQIELQSNSDAYMPSAVSSGKSISNIRL